MNTQSNLSRQKDAAPERVRHGMTVAPLVDVYESADELLVIADVPGVTQDGVEIHVDKGQLVIEAKRADGPPERERVDYFRAFSVPQGIDASKIDARLTNGILRLRLPKSEAVKPRRIAVNAG